MFLLVLCKNSVFNANSVNPDQTLQNAASDPGLHCLPMSILWDASIKWVNKHLFMYRVMYYLSFSCELKCFF